MEVVHDASQPGRRGQAKRVAVRSGLSLIGMRFPRKCVLAGALLALPVFMGCSKKHTEAPPPSNVEQAVAPTNAAPPQQITPPAQIATVQQVNANWDAVSKDIANQNYDNAVRAWFAMDQTQRQAQL